MKKIQFYIIISLLTLSACSKKDNSTPTQPSTNNPIVTAGKCVPISIVIDSLFDLSEHGDNTQIFYDSTRIDSVSRDNGYLTMKFKYNGNEIYEVIRRYYGNKDLVVNTIYNGAGKPYITKIYDGSGTLISNTERTYNSSGLMTNSVMTFQNTNTKWTAKYSYTGTLLTQVDRYDYNNDLYDTYTYSYSTDDNKLLRDYPLFNMLFNWDNDGDENVLNDGLFNNDKLINSIHYKSYPPFRPKLIDTVYNITYSLNKNGYPENFFAGKEQIMSLQYDCK